MKINYEFNFEISLNRICTTGGPLSTILFNIAIDFIYKEICNPTFANRYGFKLNPVLDAISLTGFADDKAVSASSMEDAARIIELVNDQFQQIGLEINPDKNSAIVIGQGRLVPGDLIVNDQMKIRLYAPEKRCSCSTFQLQKDSQMLMINCFTQCMIANLK